MSQPVQEKEPLSPLLDISSIVAVQSLFEKTHQDPWGVRLSGSVANALIYSDSIRVIVPSPEDGASQDGLSEIKPIERFLLTEPGFITPVSYSTTKLRRLSDTAVLDAFNHYIGWTRRNAPYLVKFCSLHAQPWVRSGHIRRVPNFTVYDLDMIKRHSRLKSLSDEIGLPTEQLLYCFDIILRYVMYGQAVHVNIVAAGDL